jgi:hypothetical protein
MSMVLQSKVGGDYKPHPEGIHPAVCVDVIDLGLVETEFQGERRMVNKVRLYFETEQHNEEGKNCVISKTFTASLHPKAKLADFLGKWRGKPVLPGESIDLAKLVGSNCTLVISHQQSLTGRTYGSIDAVSKPTKKLTASGGYDPVMARQRIEDAKAREANGQRMQPSGRPFQSTSPRPSPQSGEGVRPAGGFASQPKRQAEPASHQSAPAGARAGDVGFDPEVGF